MTKLNTTIKYKIYQNKNSNHCSVHLLNAHNNEIKHAPWENESIPSYGPSVANLLRNASTDSSYITNIRQKNQHCKK
jgi:hypothetical protein